MTPLTPEEEATVRRMGALSEFQAARVFATLDAARAAAATARMHRQMSEDMLTAAKAEAADLRTWKESALAVTPDYQTIGKLLGVGLGESVHDKIVPGIERLRAEIADLRHDAWVESLEHRPVDIARADAAEKEAADLRALLAECRQFALERRASGIVFRIDAKLKGT